MSETEFNMKEKIRKENSCKGCVLFNAEVSGPFKHWGKDGMFTGLKLQILMQVFQLTLKLLRYMTTIVILT